MEYCTFYIRIVGLTSAGMAGNNVTTRTFNCQALFQGSENKIYLKEMFVFGRFLDGLVWRLLDVQAGLQESGTVQATRNIVMTLVATDANIPHDTVIYASNYQSWKGKLQLPPQFDIGFTLNPDAVTVIAADIFEINVMLGYELESTKSINL